MNSIILNASGAALQSTTQGFYVNPVRVDSSSNVNYGLVLKGSGDEIVVSNGTNSYFNPSTGTFYSTTLSGGTKTFKIDHPLDSLKDTNYLVHSFIEGPQLDLIYRGSVQLLRGYGSVDLDIQSRMTPGTFEALCRDVQCFTSNESGWGPVKGKVFGSILTVEAIDKNSTDTISWMVIAERKDPHVINTSWTDADGKLIMEPLKN